MPNHLVFIILDSCRYDSFMNAKTPNMDRIGKTQQRFSYASWTSPSHFVYLMGQLPHASPPQVFASEVYKEDFARWTPRLNIPGLSFQGFVPHLSLPKVLREHGYTTIGRVSLPVLNPFAGFNRYFDFYKLMDNHHDFAGMVADIEFPDDKPRFYFLNLGETHYPYMLEDASLPRISGVHGVAKGMDHLLQRTADDMPEKIEFFSMEQMQSLHRQQTLCVEYVDDLIGKLLQKCPPNTYFIITADHGEMFGEEGYFGHGPVMHRKCFEVPFLEGLLPV